MNAKPSLAIVIPAYKPDFFRAALASVAAQTDQRFRLYVGDDAGPPAIADTCASFQASGLDLEYHRFEENLGGRSLTAHWNRCVELSGEPWVWLFSDDDVMAPDCVASIHAELTAGTDADVLRFDTEVIDAYGQRVAENPRHPEAEAGVDFIYHRLRGTRNSYVVEHVFRREAFDAAGGFPEYPVAWCADDVAWYAFSRRGGIRTLRGGGVKWRASGRNITDANRRHQREKLLAAVRFLRFVEEVVVPADEGRRGPDEWRRATEAWLLGQVRYLMPVGPGLWGPMLRASTGTWPRSAPGRLLTLSFWNVEASLRWARTRIVRRFAGG